MRYSLNSLWTQGIPWALVNAAIDTTFNYDVSEDVKARWVANTNHNWSNGDDSLVKPLNCPFCDRPNDVPWTTCGKEGKESKDDFGE